MSYKISFIVITALIQMPIFCQTALTATGGQIISLNGTISYSIGQIDYLTYYSDHNKLHEGVQQPYEWFLLDPKYSTGRISNLKNDIQVFINITHDQLKISITDINQINRYMLHDVSGKTMLTEYLSEGIHIVDIGKYIPGLYILNTLKNESIINSYKIIKL